MKSVSCSKATYIFATLVFILFLTTCSMASSTPTATPLGSGVNSAQKQLLLGKWSVNHGRFGNAIFDFKADGRLIIENIDTNQTHNMSYIFVDEDTIALSGYEEFEGTADIHIHPISRGKMDFTITFSGDVFSEIFPAFIRLEVKD